MGSSDVRPIIRARNVNGDCERRIRRQAGRPVFASPALRKITEQYVHMEYETVPSSAGAFVRSNASSIYAVWSESVCVFFSLSLERDSVTRG